MFILAVVVGAPVITGVVLPDESWLSGLWDGDDEDPLLLLVWDAASTIVPFFTLTVRPAPAAPAPDSPSLGIVPVLAVSSDSRAPPLS